MTEPDLSPTSAEDQGRLDKKNPVRCPECGWGANRHLAGEYKLKMTECAELCRAALTTHSTPSDTVDSSQDAQARNAGNSVNRELCRPTVNHGHFGKVYQTSNWVFVGATGNEAGIVLNGKLTHRRTINSKYGTSTIEWLYEHVRFLCPSGRGETEIQAFASAR